MYSSSVDTAVAHLRAGVDMLAVLDADALSHQAVLGVLDDIEAVRRRLPALEHPLLAHLAAHASPIALGAKSMADVLAERLRLSSTEARRRLADAEDLGPRRALTGETLAPRLTATAAAQANGQLNTEHITIIRRFFHHLPHTIDQDTRDLAETTLTDIATGQRPEGLRHAATRLAALLDPDGTLPDDTDRARTRALTLGKQRTDGMSPITGYLDPIGRATLEAVFAKLAAPGLANPDDHTPTLDGEPSAQQIRHDTRTPAQRHHDALIAIGRAMLASGQLGQHNGLPATIIINATLQELEAAVRLRPGPTGYALTAGGTLIPMRDVVRLASHAYHCLVIFDNHRHIPLYLGRTKRLATPGQRLALLARDRGCTKPGCTTSGYYCQAHHVNGWPPTDTPTSTNSPWPAAPTTGSSKPPNGPPTPAPTASPNGSPHPTSTPAKPASTTSTTPNASSNPTTRTKRRKTAGDAAMPHNRTGQPRAPTGGSRSIPLRGSTSDSARRLGGDQATR